MALLHKHFGFLKFLNYFLSWGQEFFLSPLPSPLIILARKSQPGRGGDDDVSLPSVSLPRWSRSTPPWCRSNWFGSEKSTVLSLVNLMAFWCVLSRPVKRCAGHGLKLIHCCSHTVSGDSTQKYNWVNWVLFCICSHVKLELLTIWVQ